MLCITTKLILNDKLLETEYSIKILQFKIWKDGYAFIIFLNENNMWLNLVLNWFDMINISLQIRKSS